MGSRTTLGIIAGGGTLPLRIAQAAQASGRPVFIIGLEGHADPQVLASFPHAILRMGAAARMLRRLKAEGCTDLVMAGPVRRPSFFEIRPEADGMRLLARVGRAAFAGDDGLLKAVIRVLGEEGFRILGAHEVLDDLLGRPGLLTEVAPDEAAQADIARGVIVVRSLGALDIGQGCVVQDGFVLAVEAAEGTDAMLARCGPLARPGPGGVLVKLVKPGQERRADLPTMGPETVRRAAEAGLRGLAFEGGGTILMDRAGTIAAANAAGLFLLGLDPEQTGSAAGIEKECTS
jgi:DUF1009 family protein